MRLSTVAALLLAHGAAIFVGLIVSWFLWAYLTDRKEWLASQKAKATPPPAPRQPRLPAPARLLALVERHEADERSRRVK